MTMPAAPLTYKASFITDKGAVRPKNEDNFFDGSADGRLPAAWAVADGMGGHAGGAQSSALIVEELEAACRDDMPGDFPGALEAAVHRANSRIVDLAANEFGGATIGSTVAILTADDHEATCLWAGDSRIYLFRQGKLQAITEDHSEVQQLVREGSLSPEEARTHPMSNLILRAVGSQHHVDLDRVTCRIEPGDAFLLCTDGIIGVMPDADIESALRIGPLLDTPQTLLRTGLNLKASDNVTIGIVVFEDRD